MRAELCFCINFDVFVTGTKLTANDNKKMILGALEVRAAIYC